MLAGNKHYETIWIDESDPSFVKVIDQQKLPFSFEIKELRTLDDACSAITDMTVRGAPLIGATAAFGMYLASLGYSSGKDINEYLKKAAQRLISCRPTAVNLSWAVNLVLEKLKTTNRPASETTLSAALEICGIERENCRQIGIHGLGLIEKISREKNGRTVNILTHCNAGWLACIDFGTVTAPLYLAKEKGIDIHVWVDETRPRNQGSKLTAWELGQNKVPYTLISDNAGGHLMQHKMVDLVFVGCDRATRTGDVANKTGTYLKALAAFDNNIPFYSVLPSSSIDFSITNGYNEIVIEERDASEVTDMSGWSDGKIRSVRICPEDTRAANYGFDVTPARLITGLITEKGICIASENGIKSLFSGNY